MFKKKEKMNNDWNNLRDLISILIEGNTKQLKSEYVDKIMVLIS